MMLRFLLAVVLGDLCCGIKRTENLNKMVSSLNKGGLNENIYKFRNKISQLSKKSLPCGIGGDFAERGLEFGVERGDCV